MTDSARWRPHPLPGNKSTMSGEKDTQKRVLGSTKEIGMDFNTKAAGGSTKATTTTAAAAAAATGHLQKRKPQDPAGINRNRSSWRRAPASGILAGDLAERLHALPPHAPAPAGPRMHVAYVFKPFSSLGYGNRLPLVLACGVWVGSTRPSYYPTVEAFRACMADYSSTLEVVGQRGRLLLIIESCRS